RRIKQFCWWMVRTGRALSSPLASLSLQNSRTDRRHDRRALTPEENARLIAAAEHGAEQHRMRGTDRWMLDRVAVETGLRASELRSLNCGSFALDANPTTVTVKAAYSKHRRDDTLPMRPELTDKLRPHFAGRTAESPAFPMAKGYHLAKVI